MWELGGRKFSYTLFAPPLPCARGGVLGRVAKKMSGSVWGWRGRNLSRDTWEMLRSSTGTSLAGWTNIPGTYLCLLFPSSWFLQNPSFVLREQPSPRKFYSDTLILNVGVFFLGKEGKWNRAWRTLHLKWGRSLRERRLTLESWLGKGQSKSFLFLRNLSVCKE